jgi:hypothetical protein
VDRETGPIPPGRTRRTLLTVTAEGSLMKKIGLVMAGVLGLVELAGPAPAPLAAVILAAQIQDRQDPEHFSMELLGALAIGVLVVSMALGLTTVVGVILAWVKQSRIAARVVAGARVVAALLLTPVFVLAPGFTSDTAWLVVIAAVLVIADITAVVLVLSRPSATS